MGAVNSSRGTFESMWMAFPCWRYPDEAFSQPMFIDWVMCTNNHPALRFFCVLFFFLRRFDKPQNVLFLCVITWCGDTAIPQQEKNTPNVKCDYFHIAQCTLKLLDTCFLAFCLKKEVHSEFYQSVCYTIVLTTV